MTGDYATSADVAPELVLLLDQDFSIDTDYLRLGYREVLGLDLPPNDQTSTEFIVGSYPAYAVQHRGVPVS